MKNTNVGFLLYTICKHMLKGWYITVKFLLYGSHSMLILYKLGYVHFAAGKLQVLHDFIGT